MDILIIYLLIGAAHMIAHTLTCTKCHSRFKIMCDWALEIVYYTLGWPFVVASEIKSTIRGAYAKAPPWAQVGAKKIFRLPEESMVDFTKRIRQELDAHAKEMYQEFGLKPEVTEDREDG